MGLATFDIVETNPFRHLTHLSLQLVPASDVHLKKYLAECMLSLKVSIFVHKLWLLMVKLVFDRER